MDRAELEGDNSPLGVLSPNAFRGHLTDQGNLVVIDYPKKEIRVRPGSLGEPDGKTIFAYQPKKAIPSMMMKVAGEEIEGHLDTGSSGFVSSLPPRLVEKLPLDGPLSKRTQGPPVRDIFDQGRQAERDRHIWPIHDRPSDN